MLDLDDLEEEGPMFDYMAEDSPAKLRGGQIENRVSCAWAVKCEVTEHSTRGKLQLFCHN